MFDCEVFKKDWMFVFIDVDTLEKTIIINDSDKLKAYYEKNKNCIFGGYNARSYDQFIFKGILCDENPKKINDYIIVKNQKGGTYSKKFKDIPLLIYDCMIDKMKSLKQLEGFMGNDIRETTVPFDINRKLTSSELEEVKKYCIHDVEQTIEVFNRQKEELESQTSLVEAFDLPTEYMNKTKAQLSAIILGAKNTGDRCDEFKIIYPETFKISDKYKYIKDWYDTEINRNYKMSLTTDVYKVSHIFAWGGIHGAIPNYTGEGFFVMSDVASLYPSIMLEYNFLSRNVPNPDRYREIRDTRLVLKKQKNPMQLPYKIVLNSTYGAMKDKYNQLYDPLMANNVCVTGQLLLLDLIDKIEQEFGDKCELIQSNTDGILVKLETKELYDRYLQVCEIWSKRVRLDLEHDIYVKVFQKDVNNYVIVDEKGKYKSKGAYVKKLNDLDYDLPIVNKALLNKLTSDTPMDQTINDCDQLKQFQKIIKIGRDYEYGVHGETRLDERVIRVFASCDDKDGGIFKFRNEKADKVGNTPDKAFIYNDDVNNVLCTERLDKQWYIDLANKRYFDFMEREVVEEGIDVFELLNEKYNSLLDLFLAIQTKSLHKPKDMLKFILSDMFNEYGSLDQVYHEYSIFKLVYGKKTLSLQKASDEILNIITITGNGRIGKSNITKFDYEKLYHDLVEMVVPKKLTIREIVDLQYKHLGTVTYTEPELDKRYTVVFKVDGYGVKQVKLYCLANGKTSVLNLNIKDFNKNQIQEGDILYCKKMAKDKNGTWNLYDYIKVNL